MDTTVKYVDFDPCTSAIKEDMQVSLCNNGKLLCVSICLKNVCPDRCIMLGVLICHNNQPYALRTREVCTEKYYKSGCCHRDSCCSCDDSYSCDGSCSCDYCYCLNDILVDDFEFVFPFETCKQNITLKIVAHYIC